VTRTTTPWAPIASTGLCLAGLAASTYLTVEHFSSSPSYACPVTATINCIKVTTSSYSELLGIPVAVLGLLFFVGMTALCLPVSWRSSNPWLHRLRLAASTTGVAFVIYLVWAELFRINAICLWCTAVHVVTLALFFVVVLEAAFHPLEDVELPTAQPRGQASL
jgi:uncharacterized membrane protein